MPIKISKYSDNFLSCLIYKNCNYDNYALTIYIIENITKSHINKKYYRRVLPQWHF